MSEVIEGTQKQYAVSESNIVPTENGMAVEINLDSEIQIELSNATPEGRGEIVERVLKEAMLDEGSYEFHDGTKAIMDNKDIAKVGHSKNEIKNRSSVSMKDLVKVARLADERHNVEHKKFSSFKYYKANVIIEGEVYECFLNVGYGKFDKQYHIYDVNQFDNVKRSDSPILSNPRKSVEQTVSRTITSKDSITDSAENVNRNAEKNSGISENFDVSDLDGYARENIKDYDKLSAPNQAEIRAMIREGRALGMSDGDVLLYAKISARTGVRVTFDKGKTLIGRRKGTRELVYADGFYDPATNEICVNPDGKRSADKLLIHELAHAIYGGEKGMRLAKRNAKNLSAKEKKDISDRYAEIDHTDEIELLDEYNAHYAEGILGNAETLERLLDDAPTVKDRILDFLRGAKGDTDAQRSAAARRLFFKYKRLFDKFAQQNAQNLAAEKIPTAAVSDTEKKTPHGEAPEANGVTRTNNEKMQDSGKRYALVGRTEDGRGIYRSNYPENTPKTEKQKDIIDLVQNVWSKKPINLNLIVDGKAVEIEAKFNPELTERSDLSKIAFGNRKGTASEKRITLNLSSDLYQIAEDSHHVGSKTETGKDNAAHAGVSQWHYFLTNLVYIESDNTKIDCYMNIDVKQNDSGNWFYSFAIEKGSRPADVLSVVTDKSATTSTTIISENGEKSNTFGKNSSEFSSKRRLALPEDDASVDIYTEEEYNNFGWARANNILGIGQNKDYRSKFAKAINGDKTFTITPNGEYMIPVSDIDNSTLEGVNNTIVYAKGTIDDPIITRVLKIDAYDETNLDEIRRDVYAVERRGVQPEAGGILHFYTKADVPSYGASRRDLSEGAGHYNRLGVDREAGGREAQGAAQVTENLAHFPIVDTFVDVRGKKRNVRGLGYEYMVEGTMRTKKLFPTVEEAIKAENDNIIQRYAKKYDHSVSWVKSKLEKDSDFLKKEIGQGKRFALPEDGASTDIYTEEEYNNFGWARANNILGIGQNKDYRSKFAKAINGDKTFTITPNGEYMIPVSDIDNSTLEGVNNTIVYAKGTIDDPIITRVLKIDAYDETNLDEIRRYVYAFARRGIQRETGGIFQVYTRTDVQSFESYGRNRAENAGHHNRLGVDRGAGGREAQGAAQVTENLAHFPIVDTFVDVRGKKRNVRGLGYKYMVEGTMRTKKLFPTVEEAIKAENDNIIQRYAKKYDHSVSWVKSKLEKDSDFLKKEIGQGKCFALPADSDKETTSNSASTKRAVPHTDKGRAEYWKDKAKENESRAKVLGNISVLSQKMKDLKLGTYHNATQDQSKQFAGSINTK